MLPVGMVSSWHGFSKVFMSLSVYMYTYWSTFPHNRYHWVRFRYSTFRDGTITRRIWWFYQHETLSRKTAPSGLLGLNSAPPVEDYFRERTTLLCTELHSTTGKTKLNFMFVLWCLPYFLFFLSFLFFYRLLRAFFLCQSKHEMSPYKFSCATNFHRFCKQRKLPMLQKLVFFNLNTFRYICSTDQWQAPLYKNQEPENQLHKSVQLYGRSTGCKSCLHQACLQSSRVI